MVDREKVVEGLEMSYKYSNVDENNTLVPQQLVLDALALLKVQEARVMAGAELTDAELIEEIRKAPIVLKPNVDAVPVVRCRDCKHFIDMSGTSYPSYCYKHSTFDADGEFDNAFSVEPNKYCAWGERRESE